MEVWGWVVGYVVLFTLLHLLLYYFYVRRNDDGQPRPSFVDGNGTGARHSPRSERSSGSRDGLESDADREFEGETIQCPHCGARNELDQVYTYCWNCVSTLNK